jgi:hypothetical protein
MNSFDKTRDMREREDGWAVIREDRKLSALLLYIEDIANEISSRKKRQTMMIFYIEPEM